MSDKLGPTMPGSLSSTGGHTANPSAATAARTDSRLPGKVKPASQASAMVDANISLDSASAQLATLRNQASTAAASGDLASLQQLAVHAVAIGVAAGQKAESLAGTIVARFAAAGATTTGQQKPGDDAAANLTALGLKPEEIARLFADPTAGSGSSSAIKQTADPAEAGIATGLQALAALNAKASSVITDARNLLASLNSGVNASPAPAADGAGQDLALHSLAQLLDQTESALNARIYAVGQQLGGASAEPAGTDSPASQSGLGLDLKA